MIARNVLAKGQIVIPKTIRDLMGINIGDEMVIDIEGDKIILTKKQNVEDVFSNVCKSSSGKITMKEIKKELAARYKED